MTKEYDTSVYDNTALPQKLPIYLEEGEVYEVKCQKTHSFWEAEWFSSLRMLFLGLLMHTRSYK